MPPVSPDADHGEGWAEYVATRDRLRAARHGAPLPELLAERPDLAGLGAGGLLYASALMGV